MYEESSSFICYGKPVILERIKDSFLLPPKDVFNDNDIIMYMSIIDTNLIFSKSKVNKQEKQSYNRKTLREFAGVNNPGLLKIQTVFPFTIFPNILRIDLRKVSITHIKFFWTHTDQVISIDDILGVSVQSGPLFATLVITTRFFTQNPLKVAYLLKGQAMLARRIIQGLMIVSKRKIKIKEKNKNKIINMLEKIGEIRRSTL